MDQLLSLEKSKLEEELSMLETLVNNRLTIRLFDTQGHKYYLPQADEKSLQEESKQPLNEIPVTLLFN